MGGVEGRDEELKHPGHMAWQAIGGVVGNKRVPAGEIEGRYLIERLLRDWLKSNDIWCERLQGGCAKVRVGSGLLQQEVIIKEYDIRLSLRGELGLELTKLEVYQG